MHNISSFFNYKMQTAMLLIAFCSSSAYTQHKTFYVKGKESNSLLAGVTVTLSNGQITQSDPSGRVLLKENGTGDLLLTHIGFNDLKLPVATLKDTVYLSEKTFELETLTLASKKTKTRVLLPKFSLNSLSPSTFGTGSPLHQNEVKAVFIPYNKKDKNCVISKIILATTDYNIIYLDSVNKKKLQKEVSYAPFWVNLYSVDTLIGIPDQPQFKNNLNVQRKKDEKYAVLDLPEKEKIDFPKEGIFIVVGTYDDDYYRGLHYLSAPAFKSVGVSKKSKYKQYNRKKSFTEENVFFWERDEWFWTNNSTYYVGLELEKK